MENSFKLIIKNLEIEKKLKNMIKTKKPCINIEKITDHFL